MLKELRPAFVLLALMTLLTGFLYPLGMTALAQALFPSQANGSLIRKNNVVIGSARIGQNFAAAGYFHGRPSATTTADPNDATKTVPAPYNAANSSGSNLGPTSQALMDGVKTASEALRAENNVQVPVDLVTASGSGLDPDITPAAAAFQIARVAKERNLPEEQIKDLVARATEGRTLGFIGERTVNVLKINLALDQMAADYLRVGSKAR